MISVETIANKGKNKHHVIIQEDDSARLFFDVLSILRGVMTRTDGREETIEDLHRLVEEAAKEEIGDIDS